MRRLLAAAAALVVLAGCSSSPTTTAQHLDARRAAGIVDCPTTSSAQPRPDGLPKLTLECLGANSTVALWQLRGKPMLVVFWAQWCEPCRTEMPMLGRVLPSYGDRLQTVFVLTKETRPELAIEFAQLTHNTAAQVVDPDMATLAGLGLPRGIPQSVLVDADGRVVEKHSGIWDEPSLRAALAEKLGVTA